METKHKQCQRKKNKKYGIHHYIIYHIHCKNFVIKDGINMDTNTIF